MCGFAKAISFRGGCFVSVCRRWNPVVAQVDVVACPSGVDVIAVLELSTPCTPTVVLITKPCWS